MGVEPKEKESKARRKPGRVATSCAECRRLKLRCDRTVPCQKCVTRGCGAICPDGSLIGRKGNRLVLANTEELHDRIEHLCSRIRDLEDALKTLQSLISDEPHPLLRDDLLQVKAPQAVLHCNGASSSSSGVSDHVNSEDLAGEDENFTGAFGTLSLGSQGEINFLGKTARSEYLVRALCRSATNRTSLGIPRVSERILSMTCDEDPRDDYGMGQEVFSMLPTLSDAIHLCEVYLEHGKHIFTAIPRSQLLDEVLVSVYRASSYENLTDVHSLSFLFSVFSLGSLFDQDRPSYNIEADEYYYLARAAWSMWPMGLDATVIAIQALIHMAQYKELSDWEALGTNSAWTLTGIAVKLAYSVGLHLNSTRWDLSPECSERRSRIFWSLFTFETWLSFHFGRPPSISAAYADCPLPKVDTGEFENEDGSKEIGYHTWMWNYATFMHTVMPVIIGSKQPSYATIIELDRKIRDFPVPENLRWACTGPPTTAVYYVQRWSVLSTKECTLLNLHRAYFAQALHDNPNSITNHKYLASVMAAYRSAWRLIETLRLAWAKIPLILSRVTLAWSQGLSAAIVMCILITRAPTSKMTESALKELDTIVTLFEDAACSSRSAANMLESLISLRRKAREAVDQTQSQTTTHLSPTELDRLGGATHLLSTYSKPATPSTLSPQSAASSNSPANQPSPHIDLNTDMHPTIANDMRSFGDLGNMMYSTNILDLSSANLQDISFTPDMSVFPMFDSTNNIGDGSPQMGFGTPSTPMLDATWQSFVEQLGF